MAGFITSEQLRSRRLMMPSLYVSLTPFMRTPLPVMR